LVYPLSGDFESSSRAEARLSGEAPRERHWTKELLIYSGLSPDQQALMEGALSPNNVSKLGFERETLEAMDRRAIDLLRTFGPDQQAWKEEETC
jgi:hypothetical protein